MLLVRPIDSQPTFKITEFVQKMLNIGDFRSHIIGISLMQKSPCDAAACSDTSGYILTICIQGVSLLYHVVNWYHYGCWV